MAYLARGSLGLEPSEAKTMNHGIQAGLRFLAGSLTFLMMGMGVTQ